MSAERKEMLQAGAMCAAAWVVLFVSVWLISLL